MRIIFESTMLALVLALGAANVQSASGQDGLSVNTANEPAETSTDCRNLDSRITSLSVAIEKFKSMGVGTTPYEQALERVKVLLSEGKQTQANALLERLNTTLEDQQKRFYAIKMQDWQTQRQALKKRLASKADSGAAPCSSGLPSAGAGLSRAGSGVLSRKKGDYTPLIYPIAR